MSSKPYYITCGEHDLNISRMEGYELVSTFYTYQVRAESAQKEMPQTYVSGGSTYQSPPSPQYLYNEQIVVIPTPIFVMKLTKEAEVLFGDK